MPIDVPQFAIAAHPIFGRELPKSRVGRHPCPSGTRPGFTAIVAGRCDARADGETQVRFRVGDIRDDIGLDHTDDAISICEVLETQKFAREARVELLNKSGPKQGLDTVYRFRVL